MARTQASTEGSKVHDAARIVARVVAVAAALGTVLTSIHEMGLDGAQTRRTVGNFGATWVGLAPASDTATSIGDTLHLAATVTDKHGTALVGTNIKWAVDHPEVASINGDGTVIARGLGSATVVVTVGELLARATVVVRPVASAVHIAADSAITLPELANHPLSATATDARGHVIGARFARWHTSDSTVATIDTVGMVRAVREGHATITATVDGASADAPITVVPVPGALTLLAGGGQDGPAGASLPEPITVRVLSRRGKPLGGQTVHFKQADANATAEIATVVSDANGRARCPWKLGDLAGRQRLVASTDGVDSVVTVVAEAEPVNANTRMAVLADSQTAKIATALTMPIGVRLTDTTGRVMGNVSVRWIALNGGTVTGAAPRTDSVGEVRASWVLGPHVGTQRVRVLVGDGRSVRPAIVRAHALPGPAAAIAIIAGDAQHAAPGATLPKAVALRVTDAAGNPVSAVAVSLSPARAWSDSTPVTDSNGVVRGTWTLANAPGTQHVTARVDGVPKTVQITAVAAPIAVSARSRKHHPG